MVRSEMGKMGVFWPLSARYRPANPSAGALPMSRDLVTRPATILHVPATDYRSDTRVWPYSAALGQRIADDVAEGFSIHDQRAMDPLTVPPASVILTWRKQHPEFGLMLTHADRVRADLLREQALTVADSGKGVPARLALQVATRLKLADRLDGGLVAGSAPAGGMQGQPIALELSDEDLAHLAMAGQAAREPAVGG